MDGSALSTLDALLVVLRSGDLKTLHYRTLVDTRGHEVDSYGFVDLADGPEATRPRLLTTSDGRTGVALDLWFMAGRLAADLAPTSRRVHQAQDGFWRPAGWYTWELHTVIALDPTSDPRR